jgi:carbon monoxide dehydrogenase subunit G
MKIENEFVVKASIEQVWTYMLDVQRIAPCAPGAELTEVVDDHTWKGKVSVKIGPVGLSFAGTVALQERDDAAHRVVLKADGREQRGKGAASALVVSHLETVPDGTQVNIDTDLTISGAVAQYGRGMVLDISQRLTREFAECLETNLSAEAPPLAPAVAETAAAVAPAPAEAAPAPAPAAATGKPVRGIRLGLWAIWRAVVRFFKRLFGRGEKSPKS